MESKGERLWRSMIRPYLWSLVYLFVGVYLFSLLDDIEEIEIEDDETEHSEKLHYLVGRVTGLPLDECMDSSGLAGIEGDTMDVSGEETPPPEDPAIDTDISAVENGLKAGGMVMNYVPPGEVNELFRNSKFLRQKKWSLETSFRFVEAVLTSVGYGDVTPTTPMAKAIVMLYAAIGMPIFLNAISNLQNLLQDVIDQILYTNLKVRDAVEFAKAKFWFCTSLWVGYLHLGSFIFSNILESWKYTDAFYFCFITLTTIGFGDYVPSSLTEMSDSDDEEEVDDFGQMARPILICLARHFYTYVGMSLTATWFDIAQNFYHGKIRLPVENEQENEVRVDESGSSRVPRNAKKNVKPEKAIISNDPVYTDPSRTPENNYGGPPVDIPKHLLMRYVQMRPSSPSPKSPSRGLSPKNRSRASNDDQKRRRRFASPPISPTPGSPIRSVSPFGTRLSLVERINSIQ